MNKEIYLFFFPFLKDSQYVRSRSRGISISMQIEEISSLSSKMEEIEKEIKSILDPDDPKGGLSSFSILNSIKEVGIGTISAFLGTVGDMSRFLGKREIFLVLLLYRQHYDIFNML